MHASTTCIAESYPSLPSNAATPRRGGTHRTHVLHGNQFRRITRLSTPHRSARSGFAINLRNSDFIPGRPDPPAQPRAPYPGSNWPLTGDRHRDDDVESLDRAGAVDIRMAFTSLARAVAREPALAGGVSAAASAPRSAPACARCRASAAAPIGPARSSHSPVPQPGTRPERWPPALCRPVRRSVRPPRSTRPAT